MTFFNKEEFFAEQKCAYPDMTLWSMERAAYKATKDNLDKKGQELETMLEYKNQAALLKQELSAFLTENEHFEAYFKESNEEIAPYRSLFRYKSDTIMALWLDFQDAAEKEEHVTWKYKLKNLFRHGIISFAFYEAIQRTSYKCVPKTIL